MNAVLSSKKHSPLFIKEMVSVDGHKRALWSLNPDAAAATVSQQVDTSRFHSSQHRNENFANYIDNYSSKLSHFRRIFSQG